MFEELVVNFFPVTVEHSTEVTHVEFTFTFGFCL